MSSSTPAIDLAVKWSHELRIYGEGFVGREEELEALSQAWERGVRIFAWYAEGGAGKTRVVVEWLRRMRNAGWRGARRVFVHSFYSQGSDERRSESSELFFDQALTFFGYRGDPITQADERGRVLARLLVEQRGLLILDGIEPLQHPTLHAEQGRMKDLGVARLLLTLANIPPEETVGLCLITSRQPVVELQERMGTTVIQQSLDRLKPNDGAKLLKELDVVGPAKELRQASIEFRGHAYSLMLLGSYLKNATDHHDIRRRHEVPLLDEDKEHHNRARKMFAAYVQHLGENSAEVAVLRLLGFFDRAAEKRLVEVLKARKVTVYEWPSDPKPGDRPRSKRAEDMLAEVTAPLLDLSPAEWQRVLSRLRALRLIDVSEKGSVNAHPLLRECFAEQLRTKFPQAWQAGHRRLFEYLSGSVPYWPEGIEGLKPLYQAVAHGCRAGIYEQVRTTVYRDRILRGTGDHGFYSSRKLGAFGADLGAIACFFITPWTTLAPGFSPATQAWLLNEAAFSLRALGRLAEAVEPTLVGLEMAVEQQDWKNAAIYSNNLSELQLTQGDLLAAESSGRQAVEYADLSEKSYQKIARRATLADALLHAGRPAEARNFFEDAEVWQATDEAEHPRLRSVQSFRYCDLLLSDAERAAWQRCMTGTNEPEDRLAAYLSDCDAVLARASATLAWAEQNSASLLTMALDHLTLTRAHLYKVCSGSPVPDLVVSHATAAVKNLRDSGQMDDLPRGLLTRAWLQSLLGKERGCRADLDEAWEIAERGPMPLYQADIQLTRARLFHDLTALDEARCLIEKHGYHRRDGELADALEAAKSW